ncbi:hypothetical protein RHECNPAF_4460086 [Rhizobium etli CNPAF512]|nr:hypothetical protein RHECNPAF_4460086 [Rhizobium etli CNPAF512]
MPADNMRPSPVANKRVAKAPPVKSP